MARNRRGEQFPYVEVFRTTRTDHDWPDRFARHESCNTEIQFII